MSLSIHAQFTTPYQDLETSIIRDTQLEMLSFLPLPDLLKMRSLSSYLKNLVDGSTTFKKHLKDYLTRCQSTYKLPPEQFKFYLDYNQLFVEIDGPIRGTKLDRFFFQILPWINHLIIKNCADDSKQLFDILATSQQIKTLCLCNCPYDQDQLNQLVDKSRTIIIYINDFTVTSESLLKKGADYRALKAFQKVVATESVSEKSQKKAIAFAQSLKPWIFEPIMASIWYSAVMNTSAEEPPRSEPYIQEHGFKFFKEQPHHFAVQAAIQTQLEQFNSDHFEDF
jgi:hypothetical protein